MIYLDLLQANRKIIISNELHLLYLLTPIDFDIETYVNYQLLADCYSRFIDIERKIADLIGIDPEVIRMKAEI